MEKAFEIQKACRDNVKNLQTYLTDLKSWEVEMKRKEAALNGEFQQELPPVRSKARKEKPVVKEKKVAKRIPSSDYKAWDNFDVDKACEEVDMEDVGPTSLDGKKSEQAKMDKLREEAQYEKERGNEFVKHEKWDEAISCYNRAIELVNNDAIYYANRGLCHLKKDSLHQAETDCTEALRLDPTYVKALQRRATARERLGSLRSASNDLSEVLRLEPHNVQAKRQYDAIRHRMGTKGLKSKSSPSSTPTAESKQFPTTPKIKELTDELAKEPPSELQRWRDGVGEAITVIKPVKKPPHLRSKRALKSVPIKEIPLGSTEPEKPATRLTITEIEDTLSHGDSNNNKSNKSKEANVVDSTGDKNTVTDGIVIESKEIKISTDDIVTESSGYIKTVTDDKVNEVKPITSPESEKLSKDMTWTEKHISMENMVPPNNSVQFMSEWKCLKGNDRAMAHYLSIIDPSRIPSIFDNALESRVLSDFLRLLNSDVDKFKESTVTSYLRGLSRVKRFSALAMFLSAQDKETLDSLLEHCRTVEQCSEDDIMYLRNKFEL